MAWIVLRRVPVTHLLVSLVLRARETTGVPDAVV